MWCVWPSKTFNKFCKYCHASEKHASREVFMYFKNISFIIICKEKKIVVHQKIKVYIWENLIGMVKDAL